MPVFPKTPPATTAQTTPSKLLVFSLRGEEYALPLTEIREIVATPEITPVPNMPPAVRGVANLRGRVVTVIDICDLFGMPGAAETTPNTIIVEQGTDVFGLLVAEAKEVLEIQPAERKETPDLLRTHPSAAVLAGVIVHPAAADSGKERLILALDLSKLLARVTAHA